VKFDNTIYDQYMFTSGDFSRWLVCSKDSIIGWYSNGNRPILKSSRTSTPTYGRWYRRTPYNPEDPWVSLGNYNDEVIYGANSHGGNDSILRYKGGAKVFIRDSTSNYDS